MDHGSDQAGRIASDYLRRHGGAAILEIDGAIIDALDAQRWDDHTMLLRARMRLRRLQLFEQISQRMSRRIGGSPPTPLPRRNTSSPAAIVPGRFPDLAGDGASIA